MNAFTTEDLRQFRAESLYDKHQRTMAKISEWFCRWNNLVYVAFSGGKDSTVLADISAQWCSVVDQPLYLVFVDTGLEYPEIRQHTKVFAEYLREKYRIDVQLVTLRPKMRFDEVIRQYGYPVISKDVSKTVYAARGGAKNAIMAFDGQKVNGDHSEFRKRYIKYKPLLSVDFMMSHKCCDIMKKEPSKQYEKETGRKPIIGTLCEESELRTKAWLKNGCNAFDAVRATSQPMSFWTEQDVLQYIYEENLPIAKPYGSVIRLDDGTYKTTQCSRTGCIFCGFGCHLEKESRFKSLKETHPRQYDYCIGGGDFNDDGVWQPSQQGLGLGHVFDELNQLYGDDFIPY